MSEEQLLATMAYIDLNPFAAHVVDLPEEGKHTTLNARLHGVEAASDDESVVDASDPEVSTNCLRLPSIKSISRRKSLQETAGWWLSIELIPSALLSQPSQVSSKCILPRAGLTFRAYLRLIDATSRLIRQGKRRLAEDADPISDRLHASPRSLVDNYLNGWLTGGVKWAGVPALKDCD